MLAPSLLAHGEACPLPMNSKQQQLQAQRVETTTMTVVSSLLQSLLIGLFAWTGATTWAVALGFFVLSAGSTSLFMLVVRRGWNLHFKNRWLLWAQLLANYVIQLIFIVAAPGLWIIFLTSSLVSFNYAMLGFTPR